MNNVQKQLDELIQKSSSILNELKNESPSIERIRETLDLRELNIEKLGMIASGFRMDELNENQQQIIREQFDRFADLHEQIETALKDELIRSRETLTSATRQRKAEQKYHVLEKPDITHF
ncbi:hypothetical protein DYD21_01470 [Rhodohalobacter sp. SW132]|uniref:hypothetical protein n=1 Tax=Rhodohalobacter sp. SW132 TaxID=2293433 RepID=UPI000E24161D|nr:hypothetical protein [Rhodohalobacter sp. SW132]REL38646.1 hypothetical protein DYD21_01470 [Rhodohalobacter sp. SW132]